MIIKNTQGSDTNNLDMIEQQVTSDGAKPYRVMFTGGGTAGHVLPNLALMTAALQQGWQIGYIGSYHGIERDLIAQQPLATQVVYYPIATGKLRRYWSWRNLIDPFKVVYGLLQSLYYLKKFAPQLLFSKGGYVGLPVTIAAKLLAIPVVVHESDLSVGLANRMAFAWADRIIVSFHAALKRIPAKWKDKTQALGIPLRAEFDQLRQQEDQLNSGAAAVRAQLQNQLLPGSDSQKPLLLIFGGSLGAAKINQAVRAVLPQLLERFRILHICGRGSANAGGMVPELQQSNYKQFSYVGQQFARLLQAADIVLSRAGATSIYELLYLAKPHILVPLGSRSSRGDQLLNANYFQQQGCSMLLEQERLEADPSCLVTLLDQWRTQATTWRQRLQQHSQRPVNATWPILQLMASMMGTKLQVKDSYAITYGNYLLFREGQLVSWSLAEPGQWTLTQTTVDGEPRLNLSCVANSPAIGRCTIILEGAQTLRANLMLSGHFMLHWRVQGVEQSAVQPLEVQAVMQLQAGARIVMLQEIGRVTRWQRKIALAARSSLTDCTWVTSANTCLQDQLTLQLTGPDSEFIAYNGYHTEEDGGQTNQVRRNWQVIHAAPRTRSRLLAKSVLADAASLDEGYLVVVQPTAAGAQTQVHCHALLLDDHARLQAAPELEVYCEEVSCSHGVTSGALDPEALFYLTSRGLAYATSQQLLVQAFLTEVAAPWASWGVHGTIREK